MLMNNVPTDVKRCLPLGPVLFVLAWSAYKAVMLAGSMMAPWQGMVELWLLDFSYIAVLLAAAMVAGQARNGWLRSLALLVLTVLTLYYLIDSFVVLALDQHATLGDIERYAVEWGVVSSFFDMRMLLAVIAFLLSFALFFPFTRRVRSLSFGSLALLLLSGIAAASYSPQPLLRYATLDPAAVAQRYLRPVPGQPGQQDRYTGRQIAYYARLGQDPVKVPASKPDIILVIVESLSSINSRRVSGVGDLLGRFDRMTGDGLLFRNFFANHQASEGGIISLLSGVPPIHYPTATQYMFDEFAHQPSALGAYRRQGYYTEFLTNAELSFIGLDRYLEGLGVDRARGRDEVESMRNARRVVQDAPPDDLLYAEALSTLPELAAKRRSFLLVLATTSTHLPYTNPIGGPDRAAAVWDWSLEQLALFYGRLRRSGYFDHGILLITGDHRQMRPLTRPEIARYGDSARARVPLLVIGKGYSQGAVDDRFFQQADLLRDLDRIRDPAAELSPHPIWVERYNRKYGHIGLIDSLGVFDEGGNGRREYHLKVPGNRVVWLDGRPAFARSVETRIQEQRSAHQFHRSQLGVAH